MTDWNEVEKMSEKDWNEVDRSSREEMIAFLSCQLSVDQIYESTGNCSFDLSAQIKGKRIGIELKDRNCQLSSYPDMIVTDYKVPANMARLGRDFDNFLIVSFYKDATMAICEIRDPGRRQETGYCNYTTKVKGSTQEKVLKTKWHFPKRLCLKKISGKWRKIG